MGAQPEPDVAGAAGGESHHDTSNDDTLRPAPSGRIRELRPRATLTQWSATTLPRSLLNLAVDTRRFLEALSENQVSGLRYAPAKWTLKDVLGHITDDERFSPTARCASRAVT